MWQYSWRPAQHQFRPADVLELINDPVVAHLLARFEGRIVRINRMPETPTEHKTIGAAVCAVMAAMQEVPNDQKNKHAGYGYSSERAITAALRPLLAQHGLSYTWDSANSEVLAMETSKGIKHVLVVPYTFILRHETDDARFEYSVLGTAATHLGDKAAYAAMTNAVKYFLSKAFCFGIGDDDCEHDSKQAPAPATKKQAPPKKQSKSEPLCPNDLATALEDMRKDNGISDTDWKKALGARGVSTVKALTQSQAEQLRDNLEAKYAKKDAPADDSTPAQAETGTRDDDEPGDQAPDAGEAPY